MQADYLADYSAVLIATLLALLLVAVALLLSRILSPRRFNKAKSSIYECGMIPIGEHWTQVHVRYYLFAILFVIFDVEVVFLYPWAVTFLDLGAVAFYEMVIFMGILFFGLIYAWKKDVLRWK